MQFDSVVICLASGFASCIADKLSATERLFFRIDNEKILNDKAKNMGSLDPKVYYYQIHKIGK